MLSTIIIILLFGIGGLYIYGQMLQAQEAQAQTQTQEEYTNNNEAHTQEQEQEQSNNNGIFGNIFKGIGNTLKENLSNASKGFSSLLKGDIGGTVSGFGNLVNKNVNPFEHLKTGLDILPENEVTDFIGDVADKFNPVSWF